MGTGADRHYVGRNQLDLATLDRFRIGTVPIDYSRAVEVALCQHDGLRQLLWGWRTRINDQRLERVLSTRFMRDAYDVLKAGKPLKRVQDAFFAGWPAAERGKVDIFPLPPVNPPAP